VLAHAVAGGPVYAMLGLRARAQSVAALNALLGLDQPLWRQYLLWWWHLLHGELGVSDLTNLPVAGLIATYAGQTLVLYTLGTLLALAFAAAVGLVHGVFYRSWPGRACSALEIVLYSLPGFFAQDVHRELASDYVRTARARGLRFGAILFRHVLPNAVRPVVTLLGYSLPAIFAGNVVIETVFDYPGLGWLMSHSARTQDYPVLLGIVLLVGVATMLGNFLADALNAALDPSME
jgi:peptide/nickel transport system permease protein